MVSHTRSASSDCFIIASNHAMTWRQTCYFLAATYALMGLIVLLCISLGVWLILPFAGLELLALTLCLHHVACRCNCREIITVDRQQVIVETHRRSRCLTHQAFPSDWAKVVLNSPHHRWYMSRLTIGSHGRDIEIGHGLIEAERIQLASVLSSRLRELNQLPTP